MSKPLYVVPGFSPRKVGDLLEQVKIYKQRNKPSEMALIVGENLPEIVYKVTEESQEEMTFVDFIQELLRNPLEEETNAG